MDKKAKVKKITDLLLAYQNELYRGDFEESVNDTLIREEYAKRIAEIEEAI